MFGRLRKLGAVLAALAAVSSLVSVPLAPASAQVDTSDFEFESFDAQYYLTQSPDGTSRLDVVETIVAVFPTHDQNRGIIRAIPEINQDIALNPVLLSVSDEKGDPVQVESASTGEFLELALGTDEFVHGRTTYVISYSLSNVVATFAEPSPIDEFYWDVNGTGWQQPFGSVSTTLRVDPTVAASLTGETACYFGELGAESDCELTWDGAVASAAPDAEPEVFRARATDLGPGENLTISVGFASGTFVQGEKIEGGDWSGEFDDAEPLADAPLWYNLISGGFIAATIALVIAAIRKRVAFGKGAPGRGIIVPQYSVPEGLNPMIAAHLVERPQTAFAAQVVSLAVRKKLRILDYPVTDSGAEYTLQYLDSTGLDELETELMNAIFGNRLEAGEIKELGGEDVALGHSVNAVLARAKFAQAGLGLRDPQRSLGCALPAVAVFLLFLAIIIGSTISVFTYSFSMIAVVAVVLALIGVIVVAALSIGNGQGPLTAAGVERREYLEGMKMYLELAEKERFRLLQSPDGAERIDVGDSRQVVKLYEKLLPFAVIWGVEDEWMRELVVHSGEEAPDWVVSNSGLSSLALSSMLSGISNSATYVRPAPATSSWGGSGSSSSAWSSGFGGSSGGGFSGGGGGGGGGGGR